MGAQENPTAGNRGAVEEQGATGDITSGKRWYEQWRVGHRKLDPEQAALYAIVNASAYAAITCDDEELEPRDFARADTRQVFETWQKAAWELIESAWAIYTPEAADKIEAITTVPPVDASLLTSRLIDEGHHDAAQLMAVVVAHSQDPAVLAHEVVKHIRVLKKARARRAFNSLGNQLINAAADGSDTAMVQALVHIPQFQAVAERAGLDAKEAV